jgi:hypothetical protein
VDIDHYFDVTIADIGHYVTIGRCPTVKQRFVLLRLKVVQVILVEAWVVFVSLLDRPCQNTEVFERRHQGNKYFWQRGPLPGLHRADAGWVIHRETRLERENGST